MSNVVIKVSKPDMRKIAAFYAPYRLTKTVPYSEFVAKHNGITITAYTSGKVMFQGPTAEKEAQQWQSNAVASPNAPVKAKVKTGSSPLPTGFAEKSIIGSDEVGNGSYFGPLIVCAVYAESAVLRQLQAIDVKDSKMLKDSQIRLIAPKIKELVPFQLLTVTPEKYNEIQPRYNAVRMKVALHNQAIALLLKKIAPKKPEAILIDQFTSEKNYRQYLKMEQTPITEPLLFATKGEQYHLAVAAASILCRAAFLDELEKESKEAGVSLPSGAGAKSDQAAATLLNKGGLPLLKKYAKLHFANTKKAQKIAQR